MLTNFFRQLRPYNDGLFNSFNHKKTKRNGSNNGRASKKSRRNSPVHPKSIYLYINCHGTIVNESKNHRPIRELFRKVTFPKELKHLSKITYGFFGCPNLINMDITFEKVTSMKENIPMVLSGERALYQIFSDSRESVISFLNEDLVDVEERIKEEKDKEKLKDLRYQKKMTKVILEKARASNDEGLYINFSYNQGNSENPDILYNKLYPIWSKYVNALVIKSMIIFILSSLDLSCQSLNIDQFGNIDLSLLSICISILYIINPNKAL